MIAGTEDTPNLVLDIENNVFEISGRSLPEDVVSFYKPVLDWLDEFEENPIPDIAFSFKLEYFVLLQSDFVSYSMSKYSSVSLIAAIE